MIVALVVIASGRLPLATIGQVPLPAVTATDATIGRSPSGVPAGYVAVPGTWHTRWVPVLHPPPGSPAFVKQRYRSIRYVGVSPAP